MKTLISFCASILLTGCGVISASKPVVVNDVIPFGCEAYQQKDRINFDIKLASRLPANLALFVDGELLATTCDFQAEQEMIGAFTEVASHSVKAIAYNPVISREAVDFDLMTFESCDSFQNMQSITGARSERLRFRERNNIESNPRCGQYNEARVQFYE